MERLEAARRLYADLVTARAEASEPRLREAFATVPREAFLGPGPWQVCAGPGKYVVTPSADPALIYQDELVALVAERRINNGLPSLHAGCLAAVAPAPEEHVLHIGTGTGYYTAILAELTGPSGRVIGIEIDRELAALAEANIAAWRNVKIFCRSGLEPPLGKADVIYVNAGVTAPPRLWLQALKPSGRLLLPLTPGPCEGAMLLVTQADGRYAARFLMPAFYIPCIGGQDEALAARLATTFSENAWREVRSLRLAPEPPDASCWFAAEGWWLSTAAP